LAASAVPEKRFSPGTLPGDPQRARLLPRATASGTHLRSARHYNPTTMRLRALTRLAVLPALVALAIAPWARRGDAQPAPQSFASLIERLSEEGGYFDTDNLISNERSFLEVIPALKAAGVTGGAYIGVGPDQNFSYIAQIRPSIAFIIDIRRDNLLLHLLFKSMFSMAHTRVEYLALLTGRAVPDRLDTWRTASLERVTGYIDGAKLLGPDELQRLDQRIRDSMAANKVPLSAADLATIQRFHHVFVDSGLSLKFESRGRRAQPVYPTFRDLIAGTDRSGRAWGYLAAESDFQFVKSLEAQDLVIPVVGDIGGTHALAAIGDFLMARNTRTSAFYISNIETYLIGNEYSQFVRNVARLPHDAQSVIIRSTFQASISTSSFQPINEFLTSNR
jgi:hypothetical protein